MSTTWIHLTCPRCGLPHAPSRESTDARTCKCPPEAPTFHGPAFGPAPAELARLVADRVLLDRITRFPASAAAIIETYADRVQRPTDPSLRELLNDNLPDAQTRLTNMHTDPDGQPYRHNAEQHEAHKAALCDFVSVADILPFWRYAVGPTSGRSPAIPFYRLGPAMAFFEEARRELPWSGVALYKRRPFRPLETVRLYQP